MLSDLYNKTFTVFNQVQFSDGTKWIKHKIRYCSAKSGIFDKSRNQMTYTATSWTMRTRDWKMYRPPTENGYYALDNADMQKYFTVAVGDLIVFDDIPDSAPNDIKEFKTICDKYKNCGGIVSSAEAFINYDRCGNAWKTNHIKAVRA